MHSANDVAVASSLTSTTLSSRITVRSNGGSRRASVSDLSPARSERSKATKQCTSSAKDKFDGWQRATSLNKSASLNTSSRSVHDRRIQAQRASRPSRAYLQQSPLARIGNWSEPRHLQPDHGISVQSAIRA